MDRFFSGAWIVILFIVGVLLLVGSVGCSNTSLTPRIEKGMSRTEVNNHCIDDCWPHFIPVEVGMHDGSLDVTYHQNSVFGNDAGQFLFATYRNDLLVDYTLLGYANQR